MDNCIFCKIIAGQAPGSIVYRDELVTAFMDTRPVNTGHLLIIPNQHSAELAGLDDAAGMRMFQVARRLTAALYASGVRCEGVNFFLADGIAAGQEVFHVHLHIIPRYPRDGFGLRFAKHYFEEQPARADLDLTAEKIKAGLA
jgi:histidine triad (HIT) family protein